MRARTLSRARSIHVRGVLTNRSISRLRASSRTYPTARKLRSKSHASTSNPAKFNVPCGRLSRTRNCQRAPAWTAAKSVSGIAEYDVFGATEGRGVEMTSFERANQDSAMRGGTTASGGSTFSTANSKREPDSDLEGSDTTIPVTPRSAPSQTCGSSCSSRTVARHVASDAPPTANAQMTTKPGLAGKPSAKAVACCVRVRTAEAQTVLATAPLAAMAKIARQVFRLQIRRGRNTGSLEQAPAAATGSERIVADDTQVANRPFG